MQENTFPFNDNSNAPLENLTPRKTISKPPFTFQAQNHQPHRVIQTPHISCYLYLGVYNLEYFIIFTQIQIFILFKIV